MSGSGFPEGLAAFLAACAALFIVLAISRRSKSGHPEALAAVAAFLGLLAIGGWSVPEVLDALALLVASVIGAGVIGFYIGRRRATRIIASPRLGILNLMGVPAEALVADDVRTLAPLFAAPPLGEGLPPRCDVLVLYCDIAPNGSVDGSSEGLNNIIDSSGSSIVIIASENANAACLAAGKNFRGGPINLVMVVDRKGHKATQFLADIFARMKAGKAMRSAWVELWRQRLKHDPAGLPSFVSFGAGWVRFGRRNSPRPQPSAT
jgi:hypothetical protein